LTDKFERVCIIGVGLIGGSMALGMRKLKLAHEIIGLGRRIENLKQAKKLKIIDDWSLKPEQAVKNAELIILATPMGAMPELVKSIAQNFKPKVILTDVGSTKLKMIEKILPLIDEKVDFVPAHPIAGREKTGAKYADANLFKNHWTIITPTQRSSKKGVERIKRLWQALGAKVAIMNPKEHDEILAYISHLPHLVAYGLVSTIWNQEQALPVLRFSAGGFKDFIRIAGSSPEMWRDICLDNKEMIFKALNQYQNQLEKLKQMIVKEDGGGLEKIFYESKKVKEKVEKQNG